MKSAIFVTFVFMCMSCSICTRYNTESVYYVLNDATRGDSLYDFYFDREDIIKCAETYSKKQIDNDWIIQVINTFDETTKVFCDKEYHIKSDDDACQIQQLIDFRFVLLEFCYDLFKDKKILVYDRKKNDFISYRFKKIPTHKDHPNAFVYINGNKTIFITP